MSWVYLIISILGFGVGTLTLYCNFLKPPILSLKIGKSAILIWHDKELKLAPMIDIFCTFLNDGARSTTIDRIDVTLLRNNNIAIFRDLLFLKLVNGTQWQPYEYSHPIVINKYSEKSVMIGLRNGDLGYNFTEGKYILKIGAIHKDKYIAKDRCDFILAVEDIKSINTKKINAKNEASEILLK